MKSKEWITTKSNKTSSHINNAATEAPVQSVFTIGKISVVPLSESVKQRLGLTKESLFIQEIIDEGILLRPVKNMDEYIRSKEVK